jgi:hypothetical protein
MGAGGNGQGRYRASLQFPNALKEGEKSAKVTESCQPRKTDSRGQGCRTGGVCQNCRPDPIIFDGCRFPAKQRSNASAAASQRQSSSWRAE